MWKNLKSGKVIFFSAIYLFLLGLVLISDSQVGAFYLFAPAGVVYVVIERVTGAETGLLVGNIYLLIVGGFIPFFAIGFIWSCLATYVRNKPWWV